MTNGTRPLLWERFFCFRGRSPPLSFCKLISRPWADLSQLHPTLNNVAKMPCRTRLLSIWQRGFLLPGPERGGEFVKLAGQGRTYTAEQAAGAEHARSQASVRGVAAGGPEAEGCEGGPEFADQYNRPIEPAPGVGAEVEEGQLSKGWGYGKCRRPPACYSEFPHDQEEPAKICREARRKVGVLPATGPP